MAEDRFDRFRRLERRRQPGGAEAREPSPATEERFESLEERKPADAEGAPDGPVAGPVAGSHLDRFRPAAERPIDVAQAPEGLPFLRCALCQMDHNRAATLCSNCGADLWTEPQRAFNAALAVERRSQAAVEQAQVAELERAQAEARAEEAASQRAMGEALAREVGDAERRRLDAEGIGGFGSTPGWGDSGAPGWGSGSGWRRGLGFAGWLLAALLRFLIRPRRRW